MSQLSRVNKVCECPLLERIAIDPAHHQPQDVGATIRAYDPAGMDQARGLLSNVSYTADPYACAHNTDALVIATEWEQFRALDFGRLGQIMADKVLVDLRNIYRGDEIEAAGFRYEGIGRGSFPGSCRHRTARSHQPSHYSYPFLSTTARWDSNSLAHRLRPAPVTACRGVDA
jgi:hypothetical protein